MGTTSNRSYPYPAGSDAFDVPGDLQALADAVDSDVAAIEANDWVTTARIDDGAVTAAKLATDAVETAKIDDGAVTNAKLAVPKVDQSVVGNLLTANVATGTDTLGDTTGFFGAQAGHTFTSETSPAVTAFQGSRVLRMTQTADAAESGPTPMASVTTVAAVPGQAYTGQAWVRSDAATRSAAVRMFFWSSTGTQLSNSTGAAVTTSTAWQRVTHTAVAPANAAWVSIWIRSASVVAGETFDYDAFGVWQGAGGLWAPPGTPIANLGTRTDPTNSAQVQVWNPGNNTWITV